MPYRKIPIVDGEIYHVFNRSIAKQPIFLTPIDYKRAINVLKFYQYQKPPLRYSYYNRLPVDLRLKFMEKLLFNGIPIVEIICFCLMSNHVHFLLKNIGEGGINQFMSNFQNSYAKYFNIKTGRTGSLFQPMFQAKRIETNEQLLHVSRYIHLNPVTAFLIKPEEIKNYEWSSYKDYTEGIETFVKNKIILNFFRQPQEYEKFVLDQVDYQRELDKIKHLILE